MTETKKLYCVDCNGGLNEVTVEANYGRLMIVDQCVACGGVWFDKWELYFTADEALKSLGRIDIKSFIHPSHVSSGPGVCPRCAKPLFAFADPTLPPDALIRRCDACSGLWLNVADLGKYEEHRRKFRGKDRVEIDPEMRMEMLKKLQSTLDVSSLIGSARMPDDGNALYEVNSKKMVRDGSIMVLEALIRLFFQI